MGTVFFLCVGVSLYGVFRNTLVVQALYGSVSDERVWERTFNTIVLIHISYFDIPST